MTCKAEELGYTKQGKLGKRQLWTNPKDPTQPYTDEGITLKQHTKGFLENITKSKSRWNIIDPPFDEDYSIKCINCERSVYCGKCCDNHMTQAMLDKGDGNVN